MYSSDRIHESGKNFSGMSHQGQFSEGPWGDEQHPDEPLSSIAPHSLSGEAQDLSSNNKSTKTVSPPPQSPDSKRSPKWPANRGAPYLPGEAEEPSQTYADSGKPANRSEPSSFVLGFSRMEQEAASVRFDSSLDNSLDFEDQPKIVKNDRDALRYKRYLQKYNEKEEIRRKEEEEERSNAMKRRKRLRAIASCGTITLIIVVCVVAAIRRRRPVVCPYGYYLEASGSLIFKDDCQPCGAGMTSVVGSEGLESCFCRGGYYRNNTDGTGPCLPCTFGLWAPSKTARGRISCQKFGDALEAKQLDEEGLRMWEGEFDAGRSLELAAYALSANCSAYHLSLRSAGPFICSEPDCQELQGTCFHPAPPLQDDGTWHTPSVIRRFCPCR